MPINHDVVGYTSEPHISSWTSKDALLYALGVGAGMSDPTGFELEFTTENSQDVTQRVLPTMPVVLGGGGAFGAVGPFDFAMLVHGGQTVELHAPLPVEGTVSTVSTITGIWDKTTAAVVEMASTATDQATGTPLWTTSMAAFIRGEGGWGGDRGPSVKVEIPDRTPDHVVTYETRRDQPLLYRLNGDRNPLHSDPKFAALAGFDRPILHGLCTFGFTGRALLHSVCGSDPDRFVSMAGRFSKPVFPGEALTISIWEQGEGTGAFRTSTPSGAVLDSGQVRYR